MTKGVGVLRSFAVRVIKGKGAFGKKLFPLNMKIIKKEKIFYFFSKSALKHFTTLA
jgi:hypothetical protein